MASLRTNAPKNVCLCCTRWVRWCHLAHVCECMHHHAQSAPRPTASHETYFFPFSLGCLSSLAVVFNPCSPHRCRCRRQVWNCFWEVVRRCLCFHCSSLTFYGMCCKTKQKPTTMSTAACTKKKNTSSSSSTEKGKECAKRNKYLISCLASSAQDASEGYECTMSLREYTAQNRF